MRWGELIAVRPRHIDFLRKQVTVEETIIEVSTKHSPTGERYVRKAYPKDNEPRTFGSVGQIADQSLVGVGCRPGLLVLLAQHLRGRDVGGVGDGHAACPDPGVGGDESSFVAGLDPGQVCAHVHDPTDHGRVDGVVAAVDADVVVASQPDPIDPPECRGDRRQGAASPPCRRRADRPGGS